MNLFKRIKLFFFPTEEWKWHRKTLKEAKVLFPKGAHWRKVNIQKYMCYSRMAKNEEDMFDMYASPEEKRREEVRKRVIAKSKLQ